MFMYKFLNSFQILSAVYIFVSYQLKNYFNVVKTVQQNVVELKRVPFVFFACLFVLFIKVLCIYYVLFFLSHFRKLSLESVAYYHTAND